ncbi:MAG: hypothetical protein M0Q43_05805 [Methanothrix sp.]|nr:hypothetical protein [Methanothrix sp.]
MQKILVGLISTLALLAFLMPAIIAEGSQNATANITINETSNATESLKSAPATIQMGAGKAASHTTVLRAGFEKTKPLNNLDVYGNKSTHDLSSSTSPGTAFNASQRLGNVSQFTYNTDNYKPLYNISQYSRTKPLYEVPNNLGSKPVYSISGYPEIKTANSIP